VTVNVKDAVETTDRVASHLHPPGSFDVADHPVPTGREEIWRFTPLKRLRGLHKDAPFDGAGHDLTVDAGTGVVVEQRAVSDPLRGSSGYRPVDRISARAWDAATTMQVVDVPRETIVGEPIVIALTGGGVDGAVAGHLVVNVQEFATATVVLTHEGSATLAGNVELIVGDGAKLTFVTVQDWADDAVHHVHQHALVGRDATLRHVAVSFGGDLVRLSTSVEYAGPGGHAELLGVYFADAGQHLEHRLFVDHNAPKTRSHVVYKGALQGAGAHAVWIGDVLIRKEAEGIETFETNRNLVLTDGCRADSVPNLEIETGDIQGAGHASATGRFDDEQLFYLMSRGITHDEARRLVVHGFFADIIRKIGVPEVEQRLLAAVEAELAVEPGVAST
jgi:Fe-S cluster assembly protein SufD